MRPKKEVLLLMRDEEELGAWRMRIEVWGYRAVVCGTLEEAIAWIRQPRRFPVEAVATSRADAVPDLVAHHSHVLLLDVAPSTDLHMAQRVEPSGPALPERVREALKVLTSRKRGPKAARGADALHAKPVQSVALGPAERAA